VARSMASISKCWSSLEPSCGSFCSRVYNSFASASVSVTSLVHGLLDALA
jgi:hypothetical protein